MSFALNGKVEEEENRGRLLLQDILDVMTLLGRGLRVSIIVAHSQGRSNDIRLDQNGYMN